MMRFTLGLILFILFIFFLHLVLSVLYIAYVQLGWFKILFHDIFKQCVPKDWVSSRIGNISNCRYCKKRIVRKEHTWKRY